MSSRIMLLINMFIIINSGFMLGDSLEKHVGSYTRVICASYSLLAIIFGYKLLNETKTTYVDILTFIVLILLGLFVLKITKDANYHVINASAIKEGFDAISDGVMFYSLGGTPLLVNKTMNEFAEEVTGKQISDGNKFYLELISGSYQKIEIVRKYPVLNIKVGTRAYNVVLKKINDVNELTVFDVSEQYYASMKLRQEKKKLDEMNKKLKQFSKEVEKIVNEEEILKARSRVHGEVGRALLLARYYLSIDQKDRSRSKLLPFWEYVVSIMKRQGEWVEDFNSIYVESDRLKVNLHINGKMPSAYLKKSIIKEAILEALNNGVKHAGCKNLYCDIYDNKIFIYNDGNKPSLPVKEKGGLKNIRKLIENNGGTFKIDTSDGFKMIINLEGLHE